MLQEFVDNVIAVIKESVKTFTYESLNNIARLINGISALLLTLLPGKANMLEGISGWELRPSFRGPRLPRWMESGVSSFNEFIHELSVDSDGESVTDSIPGDDHKGAHFVLSPSEVWKKLFCWIHGSSSPVVDVPTANVGSDNPAPTERKTIYRHPLNTDSRTCEDVITELGYPFEAIKVVTSDGYVLLLERIPRRDSQKVVLLQHGILDSSMGWVSNGVVGSPAFAAYDQGYDVFLGNLRGLVSREHVDKNISSYKYWKYSVNEHGTKDMPAIVEEIHKIKISELGKSRPHISEETEDQNDKIKNFEVQASQDDERDNQPYKLCAVCHSLGGAVMLMYVVTSRIAQKPHRLSRLVLLSPAGFHEDSNVVFSMVEKLILFVGPVLAPFIPGLYIPTRFFRMLLNKLARDFNNYPALGGLVQTLMGYVVGGDSSNWVGVLGLPHYNMDDMPGVSFHVALHLAQIKRAKRFQMYDYGSPVANMEAYGTPEPLDLGAHYGLIGIPVDLVAGQRDRVISPSMVKKHYKLMRKAGVEVSYNEFEYAHLDFTFSHREELLSYVMSRLLLVSDPGKGRIKQTSVRLRKLKKAQSEIENDSDSKEHNGIDNVVTDEQNGHVHAA
uniref:Partial AB-hydrolase lipase domain-containing protein n=1 Tax=Oryza glaberrima TaxID=4538 RepID=I1NNN4_ORYGL